MDNMLLWVGRAAGAGGALVCLLAAAVRVSGRYWLAGFQVGTLMQAGIALMVAGCLALLWTLSARSGRD